MTLFADTLPVDHDVRERVRTDLSRNLFVEAGAGTGKTRVLVDRVVRLVATGTVSDISRLVAITFTEAAAAELRDRIRRELEKTSVDHSRPDDEQLRCATARTHIDRATITTLHGFAQRILAEHPLDVGLAPVFDVDDEVQARVRFVERWMHFRDELFDDKAAADDLLLLHALGFTTDRLRDVARMLHQRWDALVGIDFPVPALPIIDVAPITEPIRDAMVVAEPHWHREGDRLIELVEVWAGLLAALDDAFGAGDELEVVRALMAKLWKPSNQGKAPDWGDDKKSVISSLTAADEARTEFLERLRSAVLQRFMPRLQAFTLAGVEERRQTGRLEFHDLLVHARDVLRTNQEVRVALAERIDVILIDEFQDTDPLQLDIAFSLAADDPALPPPPWPEAVLRPGKILVVGDPKQSIYRFRGADISLWDRTKRLFPDGVEQLGQNFRTVPPLLEWVNRVFRSVIAEGEEGAQPAYHDLAPFRPEVREGPAVVVVGARHTTVKAAELRELEASDLARLIVDMKVNRWEVEDTSAERGCRPARFDDIAILVPTRTPLAQLERALDANDVPYRVESRSLVWATDAVRELLAVLAAIDDPADDIAVVAALRSPGFACSDVDLVEWKQADGRWDHRLAPPEGLAVDHPVAAGMAALAAYHRMRWDLPVDRLVELVIRERKLIELTFALRRPRDHWRRLRFVLDQARAFVEAGGASLGDFVAWAQLQSDEGAMVVETPAPEPDDDAVRILTIHGSKGLEFPIVVLAGLSSAGRDTGPWVLYGDDGPEVAVGPRDARFTTPGYAALAARAGDADMHEGHRLLYVAATRSRSSRRRAAPRGARPRPLRPENCGTSARTAPPGWWNPAEFGDQLALPVVERAARVRTGHRRPAGGVAVRPRRTHRPSERTPSVRGHGRRRARRAHRGRRQRRADRSGRGRRRHAHLARTRHPPRRHRARAGGARGARDRRLRRPPRRDALAATQSSAEGITDVADVAARSRSALDAPVVVAARAAERGVGASCTSPRPWGIAAGSSRATSTCSSKTSTAISSSSTTRPTPTSTPPPTAIGCRRPRTRWRSRRRWAGRWRAVFVFCRPDGAVEREVADLPRAIDEVRALVS